MMKSTNKNAKLRTALILATAFFLVVAIGIGSSYQGHSYPVKIIKKYPTGSPLIGVSVPIAPIYCDGKTCRSIAK